MAPSSQSSLNFFTFRMVWSLERPVLEGGIRRRGRARCELRWCACVARTCGEFQWAPQAPITSASLVRRARAVPAA